MLQKLDQLLELTKGRKPIPCVVVAANDPTILSALKEASALNIITPVLIGNTSLI